MNTDSPDRPGGGPEKPERSDGPGGNERPGGDGGSEKPYRQGRPERGERFGQRKDPRLEGLISDWKKGEKDKWRGHGKKDGKKR